MKRIVEATPALENVLRNAAVLHRNLVPETQTVRKTDTVATRAEQNDFDGPFRLSIIVRNGTKYLHTEETLNGTAQSRAGRISYFQEIVTVPVQEQTAQIPADGGLTRVYLKITYNFTAGTVSAVMEQSSAVLYSSESADRFLLGILKKSGITQILQNAPEEPIAIYHRIIE